MAAGVWFVILAILACVLLFLASLGSAVAAADIAGSSEFQKNSTVRSAHYNLTIAAILGWTSLAVLIVIICILGKYTGLAPAKTFVIGQILTQDQLVTLEAKEKALAAAQTAELFGLVVLIIIGIIALAVGILAAIGASQLSGVFNLDALLNSAYTWAIVAAIAGIGGIGIMIIIIIAEIAAKSATDKAFDAANAEIKAAKTEVAVGTQPAAGAQRAGAGPPVRVLGPAPGAR
jgi:uncharacterized membrane protein YidH (DUF202 family)